MWNVNTVALARKEDSGAQTGMRNVSPILINLLRDTSAPILIYISEQYGLRRVPGLRRSDLIARLLRHLSDTDLVHLRDSLIAAHYGGMSVQDLLDRALQIGQPLQGQSGRPRLDDIAPEDARLVEGNTRHWLFTMRGHDVLIDMRSRVLACDCQFFAFASQRQALCKHLATAFKLIPEAYAREALIDLLVAREYGGPHAPHWRFESLEAA